jgi:hypothetical protein
MRYIVGKIGAHHLHDIICGGHFHRGECDEGIDLLIPCIGNKDENNDEKHNCFKIQLLHMPLKLHIFPTTLQKLEEIMQRTS